MVEMSGHWHFVSALHTVRSVCVLTRRLVMSLGKGLCEVKPQKKKVRKHFQVTVCLNPMERFIQRNHFVSHCFAN